MNQLRLLTNTNPNPTSQSAKSRPSAAQRSPYLLKPWALSLACAVLSGAATPPSSLLELAGLTSFDLWSSASACQVAPWGYRYLGCPPTQVRRNPDGSINNDRDPTPRQAPLRSDEIYSPWLGGDAAVLLIVPVGSEVGIVLTGQPAAIIARTQLKLDQVQRNGGAVNVPQLAALTDASLADARVKFSPADGWSEVVLPDARASASPVGTLPGGVAFIRARDDAARTWLARALSERPAPSDVENPEPLRYNFEHTYVQVPTESLVTPIQPPAPMIWPAMPKRPSDSAGARLPIRLNGPFAPPIQLGGPKPIRLPDPLPFGTWGVPAAIAGPNSVKPLDRKDTTLDRKPSRPAPSGLSMGPSFPLGYRETVRIAPGYDTTPVSGHDSRSSSGDSFVLEAVFGKSKTQQAVVEADRVANLTALDRAITSWTSGDAKAALPLLNEHIKSLKEPDPVYDRLLGLCMLDAGQVREGINIIAAAYRDHSELVRIDMLTLGDSLNRRVPGELEGMRRRADRVLGIAQRAGAQPDSVRPADAWMVASVLAESVRRTEAASRALDKAKSAGLDPILEADIRALLDVQATQKSKPASP